MLDFAVEKMISECEEMGGFVLKVSFWEVKVLITDAFLTDYWWVIFKLLTIEDKKSIEEKWIVEKFLGSTTILRQKLRFDCITYW